MQEFRVGRFETRCRWGRSLLALWLLGSAQTLAAGPVEPEVIDSPLGQALPEDEAEEGATEVDTDEDAVGSDEERGARLYITQSERREAGLKHRVTPWLTASFLLELEGLAEEYTLEDELGDDRFSESAAALQLGLEAAPLEFAKGEWVLEFDTLTRKFATEEVFVSLEAKPWELEAGKFYTPFGVYISHFAIGPILELGETRANAVTLSYGPRKSLDLKLCAYRGRAGKSSGDDREWEWEWAGSAEYWPRPGMQLGLSYQSNLADAEASEFFDSEDGYGRRVGAASGYFVWSDKKMELSFEALGALRGFDTPDGDRSRPFAWNLEFTRFVDKVFEWSLRIEGSEDVEDEPEFQLGPSLTWRLHRTSALTLEYLRGRFKPGSAENEEGLPYRYVDRFAAQFSVVF